MKERSSRAPRPWTDELAVPYLFEGSNVKESLSVVLRLNLVDE